MNLKEKWEAVCSVLIWSHDIHSPLSWQSHLREMYLTKGMTSYEIVACMNEDLPEHLQVSPRTIQRRLATLGITRGRTQAQRVLRSDRAYIPNKVRLQVLQRANKSCEVCGVQAEKAILDVRAKGTTSILLDESDLEVVCEACM